LKGFSEKVFDLESKRKAVYLIKAVVMLTAYYASLSVVEEDFKADEVLNGAELMELVLLSLKERKPESEIVRALKEEILNRLESFGEFLYWQNQNR